MSTIQIGNKTWTYVRLSQGVFRMTLQAARDKRVEITTRPSPDQSRPGLLIAGHRDLWSVALFDRGGIIEKG